jgi:TRAP-type mannitol/chloroaromatic compound transport system permease large subunit
VSLFGLALLGGVAGGIIVTGLPAYMILMAAAVIGSAIAALAGGPVILLTALPTRVVSLLESDLLQALPLFVFMGLVLERLPVPGALFASAVRVVRMRSAPLVASLGLGALLGPMNGSVGASAMAISRALEPRLTEHGVPLAEQQSVIAVASTFGVVVPPSLVLILLGDAMLNAHTMALSQSGRSGRIINTQDLLRGALLPSLLFIGLAIAVAMWKGRGLERQALPKPPARDIAIAIGTVCAIIGMLAGIASGRLYAVEGAAAGAVALFVAALASGRLAGGALPRILDACLANTGALFALLLAATSFTLVLRILGTDRLVSDVVSSLPGGAGFATAAILLAIGVSAVVLDAFEIIFVVIPILAPPLLVRVEDAVWVAVLILLALQTSYLMPPLGFALTLTRGLARHPAPYRKLVRAVLPYLGVQLIVLACVFAMPRMVRPLDAPAAREPASAAKGSEPAVTLPDLPPEIAPPDLR